MKISVDFLLRAIVPRVLFTGQSFISKAVNSKQKSEGAKI